MDGVYVPKYRKQQNNGSVASLDILEEMIDPIGGKTEILFDSGVRTCVDVARVLNLGADMVCVGRLLSSKLCI